jgi:hypothetical protein
MNKIIGYQIESADNTGKTPSAFGANQILSEQSAKNWLAKYNSIYSNEWKLIPIYQDDINSPEFLDTEV